MFGKRFEYMLQKTTKPSDGAPGEPSSIVSAMLEHALNQPDRPAFCQLTTEGAALQQWFSWGEIAHWVWDACAAIGATNLPNGAHVATVAKNSVEWFVLDLACQVLGHVHVAVDPQWPDAMVARLVELSDARLVYSQNVRHFWQPFRQPATKLEWQINWNTPLLRHDDVATLIERSKAISGVTPAQILFTSGTSGEPKGVLLSHRNLVSNALAKLQAAPQFAGDLRLNILPFCHAYARTCELSTWVLSNSRLAIASDWSDFQRQASALQPTLINLVPYLAHKLLRQEKNQPPLTPKPVAARLGGKVRLLQIGGAAIPDGLWYELEKCGLPPLQGYGLTEASPVVCSNLAGQQRPGTIGPPVAGVQLRVDSKGQLWVKGDGVMCGYYGDPQATQTRIQDGWLATGDLVERDAYGHYRLVGRISEVIVLSTGFKVSPEVIEGRLATIAGVKLAMLVGQDQPYVLAIIWPDWSALPSNLFGDSERLPSSLNLEACHLVLADSIRQCLADLPAFMHPRKLLLVSEPTGSASDLVTAKGSLRRKLATARLQSQIDEAYAQFRPIMVTAERTTVKRPAEA